MIYKTHSGGSSEVEKRKAIKFYYKDPDSQILNVRKDVFLAVKRAKDE